MVKCTLVGRCESILCAAVPMTDSPSQRSPRLGSSPPPGQKRGSRGAVGHLPNRFERVSLSILDANDVSTEVERGGPKTQFVRDSSRTIVSSNDSPDLPFRYSINPYRGCEHGCSYCYARPTHEFLGYDAGLDFESKIVVKENAAELFRQWLMRAPHIDARGAAETVVMSGVTDCYQPAERRFRLTRACLAVAREFGQPMSLITKNALVTRDLDLLAEMAERRLVRVAISLTTLDAALAGTMEPRTSRPAARLRTIRELTDAGVPVHVMLAPIIPNLNDSEIPQLLEAAADHGAVSAGHVLLRLPLSVEPVFRDWLREHAASKADAVESAVKGTRGGAFYSPKWGQRQSGTGPRAEQIMQTMRVFMKRHGLDVAPPPLDLEQFTRPGASSQMSLF